MSCFDLAGAHVLLDDAEGAAKCGQVRSRLYTGYAGHHRCLDPAELEACWRRAQRDLDQGLHAVVLADYEWGVRLQGLPVQQDGVSCPGSLTLLMFRRLQLLDEVGVQDVLRSADGGAAVATPAGVLGLVADVSDEEVVQAVAAIQSAIREGAVYQVNYTYRLQGLAWGVPAALYRRLRARQRVGFGAFITLPDELVADGVTHILSCSPELHLSHADGLVTARPMKGTAPRFPDALRDEASASFLRTDAKNRAENLMIVDLLRNDLGRLAEVGGVSVPSLFTVERYATVFQLTSTIQAQLRPEIDFPRLLRATFPCGSVTGAPKLAAMSAIGPLERQARGVYCGAIGWIDPPSDGSRRLGDCVLSVAIRTLTLSAPAADGTRALRAGVGAGIVLDSDGAEEALECRLKGRFLTAIDPGLALFETLRAERGPGLRLVEPARHLARLARSAEALGFPLDAGAAVSALDEGCESLKGPGPWRVRLELGHDGGLSVRSLPLPPLMLDHLGRVRVSWADITLRADEPLCGHKITWRPRCDQAVRKAEAMGAFDLLFVNGVGHVADGGRSTVYAKLGDLWCTPPLVDGVLPGVQRAIALECGIAGRPVVERSLTPAAVAAAPALAVSNALYGVVPAVLSPA